ncbi:MAG: hypothetical protein NZ704_07490 [Geminicoccaceae bacterium]|nr:hypothetical protein [Geminicoccaceae bacterium]
MANAGEATGPDGAPPRLARRPWFEDKIDRLLLLVFFVGGFFVILAIKLARPGFVSFEGRPIEPRVHAAVAAGALMVLYAFLASQTRLFRLHPERLGDNCYYLGLLYTLASLSAALLELERAPPELRGALIETLLASFGVALSSTLLGIALRVWFVQMRREIEDLEVELRRDLQEAAWKLKDQLLFAVSELESFRLRTQQVLHERLAQSVDTFTAAAERQAKAIDDLAKQISSALGEVSGPLAEELEAFRRASADTVAATDEFAQKIRAIEVPRDVLSAPARRLAGTVEQLVRNIARLETGGERLARVFDERMEAWARRFDALAGSVDRLVDRLDFAADAVSGIEALARASDPAREKLAALGDTLEQLLVAAREDAAEIRDLRDRIRTDVAECHRSYRELGDALVEIAETIVKRLEA